MWDQLDGFGRHLHQKVVSAEAFSRPSKYKNTKILNRKWRNTGFKKYRNTEMHLHQKVVSAKSSYRPLLIFHKHCEWAMLLQERTCKSQSSKFKSSVAWFLAKSKEQDLCNHKNAQNLVFQSIDTAQMECSLCSKFGR